MHKYFISFLIILLFAKSSFVCAQTPDTAFEHRNNLYGNFWENMSLKINADTTGRQTSETILNTDALMPYDGRIIRSITTRQLGFEVSISDTSYEVLYMGTKVLNNVHVKSKASTIQRNIYLKVGEPFNPYLAADNERHLRTIGFLQDSRITVNKTTSTQDSVDLIVTTKDIFAYSPATGGISHKRQNIGLTNINLLGTGQRLGIRFLHDVDRNPSAAFQTEYGYTSLGSSFINLNIKYGRLGKNIYNRKEDEEFYVLTLDRPLVSQYKRMAGGFKIAGGRSLNLYNSLSDLDFFRYQYGEIDVWAGYNIGAKKYLNDHKLHVKKFVSLRIFNTKFFESPQQIDSTEFNERFNSKQGILASITLFRQYYYKTKYIYGFGITEDIPTGFNVSITTGWYKQLDLSRPYLGINAYRYFVTSKRDLGEFFFRTGAYYGQNQLQDIGLLVGLSGFSRVMNVWNTKMRQFTRVSYATIWNRVALDPLRLNNNLGLPGFNSFYASGSYRFTLRSESSFFLEKGFYGFKFSPFVTGDFIVLGDNQITTDQHGIFYGLGGGLRTRNDNLFFGTVELRGMLYPRKVLGDNVVKLSLSVNLKFRYNNSYVHKSGTTELNSDENGDIY